MRLGIVSFLGLILLLGEIAYRTGGIEIVFAEFPQLLSGHALDLLDKKSDLLPTFVAILFLELTIVMIIGSILHILNPRSGSHAVETMLDRMRLGHNFASLVLVVVAEELFARWFFLGLVRKLPIFEGPVGFYFLFFVGNGVWAMMHLSNFEEQDRKWTKVAPQFVGGLTLTYMYLKYGLFVTILTHLGWNALLFSLMKKEKFSQHDILITAYYLLVVGISYYFMEHPLSELLVWFQNSALTQSHPKVIQGWTFKDYLVANLCIVYAMSALAELLMLDDPDVPQEEENANWTTYLFAAVIMVGLSYLLYWLSGFIVDGFMLRAISAALVILCLQKGRSGSSIARTFWIGMPAAYLSICTYEALGFLLAVCYVCLQIAIAWVPINIRRMQQLELA